MTDVVNEYLSCSSHCCKSHGCKYGYADCPVNTGKVVQEYLCEGCQDALTFKSYTPKYNEIAKDFVVTLLADGADTDLSSMPSEDEIEEAVRAALSGLRVGAWSIRAVLG